MRPYLRSRRSRSQTRWTLNSRRFVALTMLLSSAAALTWYWRRRLSVPIHETEAEVGLAQGMPQPIPDEATFGDAPIQLLSSGVGPLYVRSYQVDIKNAKHSPEVLLQNIVESPNTFSPREMAYFEKTVGDEGNMAVGDEYFIHIVGPWNGPVRVIDVQPRSFTFATLEGHLEAGEIRFGFYDNPTDASLVRFRIQSWARSSNLVTDFFYRFLGVSRFAQTTMWAAFLEAVVNESGGERVGDFAVTTHYTSAKKLLDQMPAWKRYSSMIDQWRETQPNFDITASEKLTEQYGWHVDNYSAGLPSEKPGAPEPQGVFDAAKSVLLNYEFPDPNLITGVFVPDVPLKDRVMVLRARFLVFTFFFGVHIADVVDEVRDTENKGKAQVWGYGYRTLKGHFEMGEIKFQILKYLDTGEIEFHIHAFSKPDRIANPFYRIGFSIFGRSLQIRFARTALTRMQQLVLQRMADAKHGVSTDKPIETPEVRGLDENDAAQREGDKTRADVEASKAHGVDAAPTFNPAPQG